MKKIDNRYLIYEGFKNEAPEIFKPLIDEFEFEFEHLSDSGFKMANKNYKLSLSKEITLIIWLYNDKYPQGILLNKLCYDKYPKLYSDLTKILFSEKNRGLFNKLTKFLIENFQSELLKIEIS